MRWSQELTGTSRERYRKCRMYHEFNSYCELVFHLELVWRYHLAGMAVHLTVGRILDDGDLAFYNFPE